MISKNLKEQIMCEMCKINPLTEKVYCNYCDKSHYLCSNCIEENKDKLQMRPVTVSTIFQKNLHKWK